MKRQVRMTELLIGARPVLNGMADNVDDERVLTCDLTSILSGAGFLIPGCFH